MVEYPTSAQVMISQLVGSSPTSGCMLTAQSLEPDSDSVCPSLSAPPLLMLCLSCLPRATLLQLRSGWQPPLSLSSGGRGSSHHSPTLAIFSETCSVRCALCLLDFSYFALHGLLTLNLRICSGVTLSSWKTPVSISCFPCFLPSRLQETQALLKSLGELGFL